MLRAAKNSLRRIDRIVATLKESIGGGAGGDALPPSAGSDNNDVDDEVALVATAEECLLVFEAAMCDDMNTPKATAALFKLVAAAEKRVSHHQRRGQQRLSPAAAAAVLQTIHEMDEVLGVLYSVPVEYFKAHGSSSEGVDSEELEKRTRDLADQRLILKAEKKYAEADEIRAQVEKLGYLISDVKNSYVLHPIA